MLKVDTKEKFSVVRLADGAFTVNVAEDLTSFVTKQLSEPVKNVIVDFSNVETAAENALADIAPIHQIAYANNTSFVLFGLNDAIKNSLNELDLLDILNITPTESEAWDIVQMEEIERELLGDEE